jgi:peptidoglycan/LPS O-acetylase OafA/YrhL
LASEKLKFHDRVQATPRDPAASYRRRLGTQYAEHGMRAKEGTPEVPQSSVHLDAVRGLAALVVLVGHNRDLYFSPVISKQRASVQPASSPTLTARPAAPGQITMGNEAVMLFFVLSGYLVGGAVLRALSRGVWSWGDYLIRRLTRLYVVLIPGLIFGVALDLWGCTYTRLRTPFTQARQGRRSSTMWPAN